MARFLLVRYERLDAEQLQARIPPLDLTCYGPPKRMNHADFGTPSGEHIAGAIFVPNSGYVSDPQLAAHNLRTAAERTGNATFMYGQSVETIDQAGGKVTGVTLAGGEKIEAPVVVNVGGAQSSKITDMAFGDVGCAAANDMTLTTKPLRVEVAYLEGPDDFDYGERGTIWMDFDTGAYWRPEVGGKIQVGSVEPDCDELEWIQDSDSTDADRGGVNMSLTDHHTNLVYRCALRIPTVKIPTASATQGCVAMYDVTEDWIPIYDRSAIDGFYMAIGTSGNQFKNAGVVSSLMGELVDYCENGNDHDRTPLQLHLEKTGHTLNAQMFSRIRGVSSDTSNSVLG